MSKCRDCADTGARIAPYVDGTLPAAEREAVERHLHSCPPCQEDAIDEAAGLKIVKGEDISIVAGYYCVSDKNKNTSS